MDPNRILIANGDKLLQRSLYEMLCRHGYRVDMAEFMQEAMERLNEVKHDVVIMDLHDHDNTSSLDTINKIASNSKVIVLTSQRGLEFAVTSTKRGVFDCLVKPVEDKKIISSRVRPNISVSSIVVVTWNKKGLKSPIFPLNLMALLILMN